MEIIIVKDLNFIPLKEPVCAAIGNFDGVHLGHQQLIEESKRHNLKSAVLTFAPHPNIFLKNIPNYPLVTPIDHKIEIIKNMNIDYIIIVEFDARIARMDKEDFIKAMKKMNIKAVVCGYDFTFGDKALGSTRDLAKEFEFYEIPKYSIDNVRVSTTYTRELLSYGNVKEASKLLGRVFSIKGKVIDGNKVGRELGFPTANIDYGRYILPKDGVYMCKVIANGKDYIGITNIGNNPTLNFCEEKRCETHIIDFNENLYDNVIEVFFYDRIRGEKKFSSKEDLLMQISKDKNLCIENKEKILESR